MSDVRKACLDTLSNSNLRVKLVTPDTLDELVAYVGVPLHDAYPYLSATHKGQTISAVRILCTTWVARTRT